MSWTKYFINLPGEMEKFQEQICLHLFDTQLWITESWNDSNPNSVTSLVLTPRSYEQIIWKIHENFLTDLL